MNPLRLSGGGSPLRRWLLWCGWRLTRWVVGGGCRRVKKLWDDFKIRPTALNFADPEDIARWPGLKTASQMLAEVDSDTEEQQGAASMEVGAAPASMEEGAAPMRPQQKKKQQPPPPPSSSHAKRPAPARRGLSGPGRGGRGSEAAVRTTRAAEEEPRHVQEAKFVQLVRAAMLELELRRKLQWALDKPQVVEIKDEKDKEPWRKVDWLSFFHDLQQVRRGSSSRQMCWGRLASVGG